MKDIELVIKMPEEVYKSIINGKNYISYQEYVEEAIKNGTPLQKGHGRLIDADSVNNIIRPIDNFDCEWAVTGETVKKLIYDVFDKADTIIEADTERSEDDNT